MFRTFTVAAATIGGFCLVSYSSAQDTSPKDMLGIMYQVQMAPKVCQWANAGSSSKLDSKVAEGEKAFNVSDDEKASLKARAEAELRKDLKENCDPKGLLRAMYDDPN